MSTNGQKVRILLADDHEVVRRGTRDIVNAESDMEVVAEAIDGQQAVEAAVRMKPDVAIIDIEMPRLNGIEATRQIRAAVPDVHVLVFTFHRSDELTRQVLEAGARGFVLKADPAEFLVTAIRTVSQGSLLLTPAVSDIATNGFVNAREDVPLTPRQIETIRLLALGKMNKEVAEALGIGLGTVETYRTRIMEKLDLHSLPDLVRYAIRHKLIEA